MDTSAVKECISNLIEKFNRDKHHYLSKDYLEAQTRKDFIDPFFEALGWDISNKAGLAPFEREVLVEKGQTVGRPDYNFCLNGTSKFFVEAKAPSEPLDKVSHILQAKSYAWNTKEVFIVVLTDFEEFRLFDASLPPDKKNPLQGLILDLKYTEYLDDLEKLLLLSKEAVSQGSLERLLLRDAKSKRGRIPVDKKFLQDMGLWREALAKDVYKHNPGISRGTLQRAPTLNEVVQRLLDRIVFIRIAEDRKIMPSRTLFEIAQLWKAEGKKRSIQYHLNNLFREINADLNGDIFKSPHACEQYEIDSSLLAGIIEDLYFPNSPYLFDVIGVELLGSIYERYLGSTIRVTPGGRVKVEEKPEVRKAGGVYYTPQYIVKYIVENTVGKLIEGKAPKQIEKIKILDPACGSGSFLLGAFQYLIDYHIGYYREHPKAAHTHPLFPDLFRDAEGNYRLSIIKKGHILRNNIFGVDIDPQAVEVTMMSLYLKALEGERTLPRKQGLLPVLSDNIKCGNSLIGYDIFDQGLLFPDEERERINPFDWSSKAAGFGRIMERGGFDCVIGNPPYGALFSHDVKEYLKKEYKSLEYQVNSFAFFIERGGALLNKSGYLSYITPSVLLSQHYFKNIRGIITKNYTIRTILNLNYKVFGDAETGDTCIFVIYKTRSDSMKRGVLKFSIIKNKDEFKDIQYKEKRQVEFLDNPRYEMNITLDNELIRKITHFSIHLGEIAVCIMGIKPYQKGKGKPKQTRAIVENRSFDSEYKKDNTYKRYLIGKDIDRYIINPLERRFIKYGEWLAEPRHTAPFEKTKIILRQTSDTVRAVIDKEKYCNLNNIYNIELKNQNYHYNYLLGILNSKLMKWVYQALVPEKGRVFAEIKKVNLDRLPIKKIDFYNSKQISQHDKLVSLVDRMLELNKKRHALPASSQREAVEREIAVTDERIDDLVYELYGITDKERRVIEGTG